MLITFQMDIQAPIEKAFSYLEDPKKQMKWIQGLEGTEYITTFNPASSSRIFNRSQISA